MSPRRRGSQRGAGWKPPRDRREVVTAVLAALAIVVVTVALVWFVRPNRDSGSTTVDTTPSFTAPTDSVATTVPPVTTAPPASTTG